LAAKATGGEAVGFGRQQKAKPEVTGQLCFSILKELKGLAVTTPADWQRIPAFWRAIKHHGRTMGVHEGLIFSPFFCYYLMTLSFMPINMELLNGKKFSGNSQRHPGVDSRALDRTRSGFEGGSGQSLFLPDI
jgi:hypothetical protein